MLNRRETIGWLTVAMLFTGSLALSGATPELQGPRTVVAQIEMEPTRVDWLPRTGDYERLILTVAGPGDFYMQRAFSSGEAPSFNSFDMQDGRLLDGVYTYELRVVPRLAPELLEKLVKARERGDTSAVKELEILGGSPERSPVQSGHLWVQGGSFVDKAPGQHSPSRQSKLPSKPTIRNFTPKDIVQNDDVIIQGEACIGTGCVNGDADSGATLRLKEDVAPSLVFDATGCCFPATRDWALEAGDNNTDGFLIRDLFSGNVPFRISGGAPANALTISTITGRVGVGTGIPAVQLEVKSSTAGAAAARLQSSSATGYSGIEYLDNSGNVDLFIGIDNAASNTRVNSVNNNPIVIFTNSTERIRFPAPGGNVITAANGAFLSAGGVWTNASSRESKSDIAELSKGDALKALRQLTPVTFRYKEEPDEKYVGFIAEDVPDLVAMNDHKNLSSMDVVAVLTKVVKDQQKTIDELSARLADLEEKKK